MKTTLLSVSFLGLALSLQAGWVVPPDSTRIVYSAQPGDGYASFDECLTVLADNGRLQKLDGVTAYSLLPNEAFQKELFAVLERDAPRELKEALKSAGNMHNPKLQQLWPLFQKALLATATVTKLNASLAAYGLTISRAEVEKFELRKNEEGVRFSGLLSLSITKAPKP
jgi:hypothetical protein